MLRPKTPRIGIVRLDQPRTAKTAVLGDLVAPQSLQGVAPQSLQGSESLSQTDIIYRRAEGYTFSVCVSGHPVNAPDQLQLTRGEVRIRGTQGDPQHLFEVGGNQPPRARNPSFTEPWVVNGRAVGVVYIYLPELILANLKQTLAELRELECRCLSSSCGFMANINSFCAARSGMPTLMSTLDLLPTLLLSLPPEDVILVLTSNGTNFKRHAETLIPPHVPLKRLRVCGLEQVRGFGAEVASGTTVDPLLAEAGIVGAVVEAFTATAPSPIGAILLECTELPGYSNALRQKFNLPVYDVLTLCSLLIASVAVSPTLGAHAHFVNEM
ncbi:hypothetical protein EMIHUDRAFT_226657 [Emiliania huxleyi CCMP1516]|uniref:Uncharacterized protein n=2 Tax=Emiliania huxleyi TaxID=2903 RepID=A0A0D3KAZ7_EMIH1|nr:hypothetical protein EMIHUDRAFT_230989 [Emiliania huxleyi CCMP1516]XP_005785361.1 hypothetical protein EMIHUDRAFT_253221 [Emiliania huxleyi CCMP1516]XP_005788749.1 hypothetical protein EMIHUDRAFT_226657 [Emiliania huxleyi CCMP1516]EOD32421.1 hypothetical protein EMIHUDRAFT_230989 [Emiliania huxleyi CCMP1516]EOD32932.1 hypothetical protein EMIHUDRAFT_253221 [Emiliania huxleyi CCMP1516]EOD36320.1 hypothetical protein EMIHUDRAFT_226657 [Emiliania huxleyi CCMP1516]|eukprot:XP_005784850.1 hypothetical protein EMIHUDRAFT_230989 [Emiliania huxleyi CCMP1516]